MFRSLSFVITYLLVFTTSLQVSAAKSSYPQSAEPFDSYLLRKAERYLQQATPVLAGLPPSPSPQPSPTSGLDHCDNSTHGLCGTYGICTIGNSSFCQCLQGFKPKFTQEWSSKNWSQGCVRDTQLSCKEKDVDNFFKLSRLKLPDGLQILQDRSIGLEECGQQCSRNCSCTAYTMVNSTDVVGNGALFPYGCALWFSDLINMRELSTGSVGGQDLYVRIAGNISATHQSQGHKAKFAGVISGAVIAAMSSVVLVVCCIFKIKRRNYERAEKHNSNTEGESKQEEDLELPLFELADVISATDDFSINNKLGEGGFGPVYWGKLKDGQEIAVKRLSKISGQGWTEFKNEVKLIAKVQHRNLVKLLGCCIQGEEQMLVYEYMPNNSLDSFLFDETRSKVLDWPKRFHIIRGIARGLLYLHHDSRLRIIHRDLKASNILLDTQLNPKISDFGMARIFCGDQTQEMTKRVVGTYGYMAPEYAIDGLFSVKSDVFSFGILLLEIISGKRNTGFSNSNDFHNLITFAWKLRKEGRLLEIVDTYLLVEEEPCKQSEILRCVHISLLCLQRHQKDRPSMASVIQMLGSEIELCEPKQPGFLLGNDSVEEEPLVKQKYSSSTNDITISILDGR